MPLFPVLVSCISSPDSRSKAVLVREQDNHSVCSVGTLASVAIPGSTSVATTEMNNGSYLIIGVVQPRDSICYLSGGLMNLLGLRKVKMVKRIGGRP